MKQSELKELMQSMLTSLHEHNGPEVTDHPDYHIITDILFLCCPETEHAETMTPGNILTQLYSEERVHYQYTAQKFREFCNTHGIPFWDIASDEPKLNFDLRKNPEEDLEAKAIQSTQQLRSASGFNNDIQA